MKKLLKSIIPFLASYLSNSGQVQVNKNNKRIFLIKLDRIGDYILFRNFIEILKKHNKYKDYKITLCGNILWKALAETFDKEFIEEFIWIDRNRFLTDIFYAMSIIRDIKKREFEYAIHPTFSREFFSDIIIKHAIGQYKIGSAGDTVNLSTWQKHICNKYYTLLIPTTKKHMFEFNRNKEFFEAMLEIKIDIKKPSLNIEHIDFNSYPDNKFIVLFPGASKKNKMWDIKNFSHIADYIAKKSGFHIVIAGSKKESHLANTILKQIKNKNILDMTGKITLPQLSKLLSKAELLITNDTCAVHIGLAVNTNVICLLNGNHFGRFAPYPEQTCSKSYFIYPKKIMERIKDTEYLSELYQYDLHLNINSITVEEVENIVEQILSN